MPEYKVTGVSKNARTVTEKGDEGKRAITRRGKVKGKGAKRGFTTRSKQVDAKSGTITKTVTKGRGRDDGKGSTKTTTKQVSAKRAQRASDRIDRTAARLRRSRMPKNPAMGRDIPLPKSR